MSKKHFNTVEETISWRNFKLGDRIYDLSHLDAHETEYIESRKDGSSTTYRYIVTYSFHCFTKTEINQIDEYLYHAPKESRHFNFKRYQLSLQLRDIINSLNKHVCFRASEYKGRESYAICKLKDETGNGKRSRL